LTSPGEETVVSGVLVGGATVRVVRGPSVSERTLERMLALLRASFGAWPAFALPVTPEDHLRWKLDGPPGSEVLVSLVEVEDRLASLAIELGMRTRIGGRDGAIGQGSDTATHPDFEGRGLYRERVDFKQQHIDGRFDGYASLSLNPRVLRRRDHDARPELANAPRVLARVYDAARVARDQRSAAARVPPPLLTAGLVPLALGPRLVPPRRRSSALRVTRVERFDERFDALFEECAPAFDLVRERSCDYLNWRFADPRAGAFESAAAFEGDDLVGYVVWRATDARAYVVDALVNPGRGDALDALLLVAERAFRDAGAAVALAWLPRWHPYRAVFRRRGFLDTRRPTGASLRLPPEESGRGFDPALLTDPRARLHTLLGDTDLV